MSERSILWLTDRSRFEQGLDFCQRARYLSTSFGPSGYGIQRKATSLPLATGSYVHEGIAEILQFVRDRDKLPPDEIVRHACLVATQTYTRVVEQRGMAGLDEGQRLEEVILEQGALIQGLVWAFTLTTLPWIHEQARILEVEREEILICGCTCGLGDGVGGLEDHEGRGCSGIGFQSRPDFITEYRARPGILAYWELKTVGAISEPWESQWETKIQFSAGALGAQARLEQPIQEAWVVGLIKGRREGDTYNPETKRREGSLRQQSPLCYGWKKAANPPLEAEDWQTSYEYRGEDGKGHRLGKAYNKAGIWELGQAVPLGDLSVSEFWCKWMPQEQLGGQVRVIGPLNISPVLTHDLVEELVAEETRWKETCWLLFDVLNNEAGGDWTHPAYQAELRRRVPRSWACRRYGKRHECQHKNICFYGEGWQDPLNNGYILRRPHHTPERLQLQERGLAPAEGWPEDAEEDQT